MGNLFMTLLVVVLVVGAITLFLHLRDSKDTPVVDETVRRAEERLKLQEIRKKTENVQTKPLVVEGRDNPFIENEQHYDPHMRPVEMTDPKEAFQAALKMRSKADQRILDQNLPRRVADRNLHSSATARV